MIARVLAALAVTAACGDNLAPSGSFELVGHADLGARGMNSALAIAGDTAYVGSRIEGRGVEIVDIADPARPTVVGEIGPPDEGLPGMSSRELRVVPSANLLIVMNLACSPALHGCAGAPAEGENLKIYDITNRRAPRLITMYLVIGNVRYPRSPHEMFLCSQPGGRTLLLIAAPPSPPSLEIVDLTERFPRFVTSWDPVRDGGLDGNGTDNILHSVSTSDDGRVGYLSHQTGGLVVVDLGAVIDEHDPPTIRMITPPAQALDWAPPGMGPHSAVAVPDRPLLVVTEEVYPMPYGAGCPWGHLRTVDISDPARPVVAGEFALPENRADCASFAPFTAFTAHNATVTHDLALVTWYAGGLQAIDISDAAHPAQLAELRPEPLATVDVEDPGLGGNPVEMWSYPVIVDGLIYVVDVRNGLYVLRYHGRWGEQITERRFLEGNSNLGAYLPRR